MTRLKKVLTLNICILLSLFVMLVFTSCGEKSESDNNTESTTINTSTSDTKPEVTKYKVTFDSNGGNEVEPQFVELNKRINEPEIPIRLGYTFDGWYAGSEKWVFLQHTVVDDITLKAKWTPNENTLTFDANGATGTMSNMTIATDSVVSLTPNSFVKDGYTFVGWSTNVDGEVEYTDGASYTMGAEESYTLYAVWETIIKYTICYEKNGGIENNENPTTFTIDDLPITLNDLDNKTDYLFDFWYKESDFSGTPVTQITDAENIKLYASYINGTDGLVFSQDGEAWRITGYNGTATNVVIPNTYKNREVISIDALAFFDCTGITSIEIPDSVTSIGDNAFYNCTELTSVNYLGTIEQWCNISFSIYSSNPLCNGANLYVNGEEINNLVIPNTVTEIKDSAFLGCKSLISATIPDRATLPSLHPQNNCCTL